MKKIRVTVSCELEIPDDWNMRSPIEDEPEHLMIEGKFYEPGLMWLEYKGKDAEGYDSWEGADDTIEDLIQDQVRVGSYSIEKIKKFSLEG